MVDVAWPGFTRSGGSDKIKRHKIHKSGRVKKSAGAAGLKKFPGTAEAEPHQFNGGCSSVGRALDCDSSGRGFKSRQPPQFPASIEARHEPGFFVSGPASAQLSGMSVVLPCAVGAAQARLAGRRRKHSSCVWSGRGYSAIIPPLSGAPAIIGPPSVTEFLACTKRKLCRFLSKRLQVWNGV